MSTINASTASWIWTPPSIARLIFTHRARKTSVGNYRRTEKFDVYTWLAATTEKLSAFRNNVDGKIISPRDNDVSDVRLASRSAYISRQNAKFERESNLKVTRKFGAFRILQLRINKVNSIRLISFVKRPLIILSSVIAETRSASKETPRHSWKWTWKRSYIYTPERKRAR